jgi:hypothetical protein
MERVGAVFGVRPVCVQAVKTDLLTIDQPARSPKAGAERQSSSSSDAEVFSLSRSLESPAGARHAWRKDPELPKLEAFVARGRDRLAALDVAGVAG